MDTCPTECRCRTRSHCVRRIRIEYIERAMQSMALHVEAMLALQRRGAITFDYGNNIRTQAKKAGVENAFDIPGFVPEYIRPLFCEGKGPFRWVALSGDPEDIARRIKLALEIFPENKILSRWMKLAKERIHFQGLPARICWLGYGERAEFGVAMNELVRRGEIKAPIVIGRDHLDTGSVASPFRETEAMVDGSDAIADWPLLNALVNTASGASWVSIHNGGGVGIGYSQHAGMVVVADGTDNSKRRLARVLTSDPGMGVIRHADAGYSRAIDFAKTTRASKFQWTPSARRESRSRDEPQTHAETDRMRSQFFRRPRHGSHSRRSLRRLNRSMEFLFSTSIPARRRTGLWSHSPAVPMRRLKRRFVEFKRRRSSSTCANKGRPSANGRDRCLSVHSGEQRELGRSDRMCAKTWETRGRGAEDSGLSLREGGERSGAVKSFDHPRRANTKVFSRRLKNRLGSLISVQRHSMRRRARP